MGSWGCLEVSRPRWGRRVSRTRTFHVCNCPLYRYMPTLVWRELERMCVRLRAGRWCWPQQTAPGKQSGSLIARKRGRLATDADCDRETSANAPLFPSPCALDGWQFSVRVPATSINLGLQVTHLARHCEEVEKSTKPLTNISSGRPPATRYVALRGISLPLWPRLLWPGVRHPTANGTATSMAFARQRKHPARIGEQHEVFRLRFAQFRASTGQPCVGTGASVRRWLMSEWEHGHTPDQDSQQPSTEEHALLLVSDLWWAVGSGAWLRPMTRHSGTPSPKYNATPLRRNILYPRSTNDEHGPHAPNIPGQTGERRSRNALRGRRISD